MTTTPVKVALRVRPLKSELDKTALSMLPDERSVRLGEKSFTFDFLYSSQSTQEDIFKSSLLPLVQAFTRGDTMTLLAYGQTGSGKTVSLGTGFETNLDGGLIQRCANWIFACMIEKSSKSLGRDSFEMYVEMGDLSAAATKTRLDSVHDVSEFLRQNSHYKSSLFSIILEQHIGNEDMITLVENDIPTTDKHIISKFNFVHLASECPNSLLSALGHRRHVPAFEDCKLTRLLKDNSSSHILLLACVSPSMSDYTETLKTVENIRTIQNSLLPNEHDHLLRQEINRAHSEIESLRQQLADAKQHHFHGPPSTSSSVSRKKKRPVIHRMKSTQSCCLPKKKNNNIDGLLDLLRKEYLYTDEKSIDETVLHPSHAEADATVLDENELEALSVPSWSDAPKSNNGSSKRKSISLDSMWDDTDSSTMTTAKPTLLTASKSKDNNTTKRQSKNILKMLHQIQADLLVKRELVDQLEKSQEQFVQLKANYEERLNELKDHVLDLQNGRDAALKKSGITIVPVAGKTTATRPVVQLRENRQAADVRSQYEVKLKLLVAENMELRKKHHQSTHSVQTGRAKAEGIIGRLRADIEALKLDKKQLNKGLKHQVDKSRETISAYEKEVQILKRREIVALDAKKKLEQVNEAQGQVLKKRTEETAAVNLQIRQLTNVLRRAANEGTFLNEASLERILNDPPVSPKNVIRRPVSRLFIGNSSSTSSPID